MVISLIIIICIISILAFRFKELANRLALNPYDIYQQRQIYRVFTHAFLHADYVHLIINMIVFWSFGMSIERIFSNLESYDYIASAQLHLLLLVIIGIIGSSISTILKHRTDPSYSAVGASGMVSAFVFAHIFFQPMQKIYFYFAIPIPGILFGIIYLVYSSYMGRKQTDNINHDAHLWGAVIGFLYPLIMEPSLIHVFIDNLSIK